MPKKNINIEEEEIRRVEIPDGYYLLEDTDTILIKAKGYPGVIECYDTGALKNWWYDEECNFNNGKLTLKIDRVGYMYPPLYPSGDRVPEVEDLRRYLSEKTLKDLDPSNPQGSINKVRYSQISDLLESKKAEIAQLNEDIEFLTRKLKFYE